MGKKDGYYEEKIQTLLEYGKNKDKFLDEDTSFIARILLLGVEVLIDIKEKM